MNRQRWNTLQHIFHTASELPADEQERYVQEQCGQDAGLAREVMALLGSDRTGPQRLVDAALGGLADGDEPSDPEQIGPYRILRRIGSGGMGLVYLAERADGAFDKQVALKLVKLGMDTEEVLSRFQVERAIMARLDHENIAALLDGGVTDDGRPFFVMEYVDGSPIDAYCDAHSLGIRDRLRLFRRVCGAVHYAHQSLVIHRDLKPSNVLVTEDGQVKLLDFGIAKLLDESGSVYRTRTGRSMLTPAYAAPEQIRGDNVTTAADVYALGVLLYQLLAGRRPFTAHRSDAELRDLVLRGDPPAPSTVISRMTGAHESTEELAAIVTTRGTGPARLRKSLQGDLDNICLKALQTRPGARYASADQVADDVERHLRGLPVVAGSQSVGYRFAKFVRRNRAAVATAAGVVALLAAVITFYTQRLAHERDAAVLEQRKTAEVVDFVIELFRVADPSTSRGETISARQLLDDGVARIERELQTAPAVKAKLLTVLGEVYYMLGLGSQAEPLIRDALQLHRNLDEPQALDLATGQIILGFIHQDRGEYDAADALYRDAAAARRALLPPAHQDVVEAISVRAFLEESVARYSEAEALYRRALTLARQRTAGDDELTAQAMTKLAGVLRILDRNEEAERLLRDALGMQQRIYQGIHPELATTQRHLAGLLRNTRRFEESKGLYQEVIDARLKMLGPDHLEVAHTYNSYSQLLSDMGETDAAIEATRTMIDIVIRNHGEVHPSLGAAYNNMAVMLRDQGDRVGALDHYRRSLNVLDALDLPADHPNRSFPMGGIAGIHLLEARYGEAERVLHEALALRRANYPTDHRLILELESDMGAALTGQGRYAEAQSLLSRAHELFLRERGADDPRTRKAKSRLEALAEARVSAGGTSG